MKWKTVLVVTLLTACQGPTHSSRGDGSPDTGAAPSCLPDAGTSDLCSVLAAPIASSRHLPALAAAVSDDATTLAAGVTRIRKHGAPTHATLEDTWHLGSDTKAMTATLVATFVDAGALSWTTTLAQAFPGWTIDPVNRNVTLQMLMSHVGGLIRARVFTRLGMVSCDFGPMATPGLVDEPWGHTLDAAGNVGA